MADVQELNINSTTYDIKAKSVVDTNSGALKFWTGNKTQYDAIQNKDSTTLYNITDDYADIDISNKLNTTLNNITNTGKRVISYNSLPSSVYKELTLGATATSYTAPADGWIFLYGQIQSGYSQCYAILYNEATDYRDMSVLFNGNYGNIVCWLPVRKNDGYQVHYGNYVNLNFRFYYANGSDWEAS